MCVLYILISVFLLEKNYFDKKGTLKIDISYFGP